MSLRSLLPIAFCAGAVSLLALCSAYGGVTWAHQEVTVVSDFSRKPIRVVFPFTNTGEAPIRVVDIRVCCNIGADPAPDRDFAPGEKGEIVVWLYPKGHSHPFSIDFKVTTEDGVTTKLMIHTEFADALAAKPDSILWKRGDPPEPKTVDIEVRGSQHSVTGLNIQTAPPGFTTRITTLEAGKRYRVLIAPKSTAIPQTASIVLTAEGQSQPRPSATVSALIR